MTTTNIILTNPIRNIAKDENQYVVTLMSPTPNLTFGELCQLIENSVNKVSAVG